MTALCCNWVICVTGQLFCTLNGNLEPWQVPHRAIKGGLIISHLHFSFALPRSRPPSVAPFNVQICLAAAPQSQLWLSLRVLKWGLQKVNKLFSPPPPAPPTVLRQLPAAAHLAPSGKFRRCTWPREGPTECLLTALGGAVGVLASCWE